MTEAGSDLSLPLTEVWSLIFLAILFQYLLQSANYMPSTELHTRDSKEKKGRHDCCFPDVQYIEKKTDKLQIIINTVKKQLENENKNEQWVVFNCR